MLCGDAFDRGPDSIKVFEFLKKLNKENRLIYIRGNHEDLLFECIEELLRYGSASGHHYSNGTIKTLSHFLCEDDFWMYSTYIPSNIVESIMNSTKELQKFIKDNCRNYFELGNKVFVHSWLPINGNILYADWRGTSIDDLSTFNQLWKDARWGNPFIQWEAGLQPEGSCIVFGHWHTSYYWSHIKQERKEFPQKNRKDWWESFKPVICDTIIGLDGCVAFSGIVNCVVFDENGDIIEC